MVINPNTIENALKKCDMHNYSGLNVAEGAEQICEALEAKAADVKQGPKGQAR